MEFRTPWDPDPPPANPGPKFRETEVEPASKKPRGRRPLGWSWAQAEPKVDFVYCHLTIAGSTGEVQKFAAAARGSGVIPWQLDFDMIEEDIFNLAVSPAPGQRSLTVAGCRLLARQFRERVEARQAKVAALVGRSLACPFDLQALVPVPPEILRLGPTHSASLTWLHRHWGPPEGLRKITILEKPRPGKRLPADHTIIGYGFFSRARPPSAAVETIAASWPVLKLRLRYQSPAPGDAWTG